MLVCGGRVEWRPKVEFPKEGVARLGAEGRGMAVVPPPRIPRAGWHWHLCGRYGR